MSVIDMVDARPDVGSRVRPYDNRGATGTVVRRPAGVTYVIVLWDSDSAFGPWEQQVTFAERYLTVLT